MREGEELAFTGVELEKAGEPVLDAEDPEVMYGNLSKKFKSLVVEK